MTREPEASQKEERAKSKKAERVEMRTRMKGAKGAFTKTRKAMKAALNHYRQSHKTYMNARSVEEKARKRREKAEKLLEMARGSQNTMMTAYRKGKENLKKLYRETCESNLGGIIHKLRSGCKSVLKMLKKEKN